MIDVIQNGLYINFINKFCFPFTKGVNMQVHTYKSSEAGIFANAYLIETSGHVIALDSTLLESTSKELRNMIEATRKPLAAILITHGHPDHYNGVTNVLSGESVDIISTQAVAEVIREYDEAKEKLWKPVFKDE